MLSFDSLKALATEKIMGALGQEAPTPAPPVPPMEHKADSVPTWVWGLGAAAVLLYLGGFFGKRR